MSDKDHLNKKGEFLKQKDQINSNINYEVTKGENLNPSEDEFEEYEEEIEVEAEENKQEEKIKEKKNEKKIC